VTKIQGTSCKKLLDDLKDRRGFSHLNVKALGHTMWMNRFGRGFGPVVRQNTVRINVSCFYVGVVAFFSVNLLSVMYSNILYPTDR
jgi:hypothetical protein